MALLQGGVATRRDQMTFAHPQYLVETEWLEGHLHDTDLRILDCSVSFFTDDNGVHLESGRGAWARGHVPGSGFADLIPSGSAAARAVRNSARAQPTADYYVLWGRHCRE